MSTVPPHPDDVREGLRQAAAQRAEAKRLDQDAVIDMADWAIRAQQTDGVTMSEVAEIVGMTRGAVYDLIDWRAGRKPTRA